MNAQAVIPFVVSEFRGRSISCAMFLELTCSQWWYFYLSILRSTNLWRLTNLQEVLIWGNECTSCDSLVVSEFRGRSISCAMFLELTCSQWRCIFICQSSEVQTCGDSQTSKKFWFEEMNAQAVIPFVVSEFPRTSMSCAMFLDLTWLFPCADLLTMMIFLSVNPPKYKLVETHKPLRSSDLRKWMHKLWFPLLSEFPGTSMSCPWFLELTWLFPCADLLTMMIFLSVRSSEVVFGSSEHFFLLLAFFFSWRNQLPASWAARHRTVMFWRRQWPRRFKSGSCCNKGKTWKN